MEFSLKKIEQEWVDFYIMILMNAVYTKIENLNTQFYYDFSVDSYNEVIQNGYKPSQIILGMTHNNNNEFEIVNDLCKSN